MGSTVLRLCRAVLARIDAGRVARLSRPARWRECRSLADHGPHHKTIARRAQSRRAAPLAEITGARSTTDIWEPPDDLLWAALDALATKQRQAVAYHCVAGRCRVHS
jgi:hypothetical protein